MLNEFAKYEYRDIDHLKTMLKIINNNSNLKFGVINIHININMQRIENKM